MSQAPNSDRLTAAVNPDMKPFAVPHGCRRLEQAKAAPDSSIQAIPNPPAAKDNSES